MKEINSKFNESYPDGQKTRKILTAQRPKHCENNNTDDGISTNLNNTDDGTCPYLINNAKDGIRSNLNNANNYISSSQIFIQKK